MQVKKVVDVPGRGEVVVREVTMRTLALLDDGKLTLDALRTLVDDAITPGWAELAQWYPSEIEVVVKAFCEVNSGFLGIARALKAEELLANLVEQQMKVALYRLSLGSLSAATSTPGIMDGQPLPQS